ncbi:MAG: iron-containing alcohol dehydrogenase [Saccharolobus sp.]|uniref:iron-containing alcohol dehydrogenase n=3 Tax=Sulfolobaceae TaxID=118883 RepID=UPI001F0F86DB|nr:iron-containing alcohol dehydrogenase [Saccharolobus shibatae]MCH4815821.1 iron-containing alcohol dehydrogenase [Saccharolobus shibatae]
MWVAEFNSIKVFYGRNSLSYLNQLGLNQVTIVVTKSLLNSQLLKKMENYVNIKRIIQGPSHHIPEEELNILIKELSIESTVISLGGGSIIDAVKLAFSGYHIAIPTTLSGAEYTYNASFKNKDGFKVSRRVKNPDVIILDPEVLEYTPKSLLITTAVKALDHAVEAYYSNKASPFTDVLSAQGINMMLKCLENNLDDLEFCQIASWISSYARKFAGMGISHSFGHVFGPKFNIPHGVTSCISLPEAIRFNKSEKLSSIYPNLDRRIENILNNLGINERLSKYAKFEDIVELLPKFVEAVNSGSNPKKITMEDAKMFVKNVYY